MSKRKTIWVVVSSEGASDCEYCYSEQKRIVRAFFNKDDAEKFALLIAGMLKPVSQEFQNQLALARASRSTPSSKYPKWKPPKTDRSAQPDTTYEIEEVLIS